jgi:hypothetical protein
VLSEIQLERSTSQQASLIERLRKNRIRLFKVYVLHVGWFTSTCACAATGSAHLAVASALWLTLITIVPVLIYVVTTHRAIRAIAPTANSVGLKQIIVSILCFTPLEAALILPAINLWISCRLLREWHVSVISESVDVDPDRDYQNNPGERR